ncbi:DegT/DnrJ/EryC1/StrS aminotransferase family protein [Thermoactinomyces sp. CICC 23799]|uniref:DegT/DnrJ/EryC1/StrS family aminotransferase n=1 Tax=Thermoactinomyces sp. CICC 23799 TaxID=2767429 RepID=UPI0018DCF5CE|nr:DegT/DnrJ/EryC1/StrS family aminotransferase [Thermoactinomyces sp. CICC 23799]MBH8601385.1 DegT/DnrJ/EryC1/StrS family aminotransferase [Thermoactinomyces sp. CICC 23799]
MSKLALFGGEPVIKRPKPHFSWPPITQEDIKAVNDQLLTGELSVYGRSGIIKEFEDAFASYHGMKYAVATNAGTTALHSAFFGCGLGPGDEVLAPTYTFLATVTPIFHVNAIPILVDADPETGNIDVRDMKRKITSRTRAIVVTHMWGHPCEMDEIMEFAQDYNLKVIEDCSHAHGSKYKGQLVGTFGDVACWSLQGNKMVTGGEGGILLTNSQEIYERATLLGHYRDRSKQCVTSDFYKQFVKTGYGLKYRMHVLAAALAKVSLSKLDQRIQARGENLNYFSQLLEQIPGVEPPVTKEYVSRGAFYGYKPLYQQEEMDGIPIELYVKALQAEGVEIKKPGSRPLHMLPLFQTLEDGMYHNGWPKMNPFNHPVIYKDGDLPQAEAYYQKALSLPTFTDPEDKKLIEQYAVAFEKVYRYRDELLGI